MATYDLGTDGGRGAGGRPGGCAIVRRFTADVDGLLYLAVLYVFLLPRNLGGCFLLCGRFNEIASRRSRLLRDTGIHITNPRACP